MCLRDISSRELLFTRGTAGTSVPDFQRYALTRDTMNGRPAKYGHHICAVWIGRFNFRFHIRAEANAGYMCMLDLASAIRKLARAGELNLVPRGYYRTSLDPVPHPIAECLRR